MNLVAMLYVLVVLPKNAVVLLISMKVREVSCVTMRSVRVAMRSVRVA
jgi:hypothetical protein